jgi:hypothetical protein
MEDELSRSWTWTRSNRERYSFGLGRVCRGQSCGTSADRLRTDLEAEVKPQCWISSAQLTPGKAGKLFNTLIGRPLGIEGPLAYMSVHYVVKYQPCSGQGPNYYFDAYLAPRYGVLDPSREIP